MICCHTKRSAFNPLYQENIFHLANFFFALLIFVLNLHFQQKQSASPKEPVPRLTAIGKKVGMW